jgi:L-amino acid N-acyltransferase YncA
VKDYGEGIYSLPETDARRYVSVPASLLLRTEQRSGSVWVLENGARHIVATANVLPLDTTLQRQIGLLDFLVHPMAVDHAQTLLTRVIDSEREEGLRTLRAYLAGCDDDKRALLQAVGFQARATLPDQLTASDQRWDLVIYDLALDT